MHLSKFVLAAGLLASALALAACNRNPLLVKRSQCPAVAVPAYAGSVTRFEPAQSRDADAIDLTAQLVDVAGQCIDGTTEITSNISFTVTAQRREAAGPREVYLPLFVGLVQGGNVLVSKQQTGVMLRFADGQLRAEAHGGARADVQRSAATLPADVQEKLSQKRRPNRRESLVDPMADPQVRAAVRAATFEVLVGFQLDDPALAYNVGK